MTHEFKRIEIKSVDGKNTGKVKIRIVDYIDVSPGTEVSICARDENGQLVIVNHFVGTPEN